MPAIIGAPTFREFSVTLVLTCACENHNTLLTTGKVGMIFGCNFCKRMWRVESMALDKLTGQVELELAEVRTLSKGLN